MAIILVPTWYQLMIYAQLNISERQIRIPIHSQHVSHKNKQSTILL